MGWDGLAIEYNLAGLFSKYSKSNDGDNFPQFSSVPRNFYDVGLTRFLYISLSFSFEVFNCLFYLTSHLHNAFNYA